MKICANHVHIPKRGIRESNFDVFAGYNWLIIAVLVLIIALCIGLLGRSREFQVNNYGSHYGNNYGYCRAGTYCTWR